MGKISLSLVILIALYNPVSICNNISYQSHQGDDSLKIIEKVYLHTDRDCYYPGDDIWFKAYLIDASYRLLSNHSNNLHVELISPASKIIESRIIRLNEGLGNGDFRLPEDLKSGRYRIRAYTNYMRNFDDQLFFNKDITIINSSDNLKAFSDNTKYINNKLEISFFPEGGSLVNNISSNVAFKAVNAIGEGCDITGEIYSSTGDKVTTIKSTHLGMGTFSLKPLPGLKYYAIVKSVTGDEAKSEIPGSFSSGVTLNISRNDSNELVIVVRTNIETLPLVLDHDLTLTVSARNIPYKAAVFKIKSLIKRFIFPTKDLPDGIAMFTLSGLDKLPLCERLVYIQNNEEVRVKVETDKRVYKQRDSVSVKISLSKNSGIAQETFLSLSAAERISANSSSQFPSTISSWFLLESDVHGPVEEPSYYFDPSNPNRLEDLDLLLLTQGWRDFEWKYKGMNYLPETGFTVSGRLRKLFANVPLENSKVNIAILRNENSIICTLPTDSSGRFNLKGVDLTGDARLVVSGQGKKEHLQGWILMDSLKYSSAEVQEKIIQSMLLLNDNPLLKENINENTKALIQDAEIKQTIRKKYKLSDTISLNEVKIIAKRPESIQTSHIISSRQMYGSPDKEFIVTPQLQNSQNLISLINGRFTGVWVIRNPEPWMKDSQIRIRGGKGQPLFVLDGMIVTFEDVNSIPVSIIDRIDILYPGAAASIYGMHGEGGVISVITRTIDTYPTRQILYSVNIKFSGYNEPRIFYSPKHSSTAESDYNPDLRTTLFWEPNIKLENNQDLYLKYFNADNSSTIKVIVEGITTTGVPVTASTEYDVR
jgi:Large extracellular alpha-helical protein